MSEKAASEIQCKGCYQLTSSRLKCPKCVSLSLPDAYFCSQDCFKKSWGEHHRIVHKPAALAQLITHGKDSMKTWKLDDPSTWLNDARTQRFLVPAFKFTGSLRPFPMDPPEPVPRSIPRPDYAETGRSRQEEVLRSQSHPLCWTEESDLEKIRYAGRLARECLDFAHSLCVEGVTGQEVDDKVFKFITEHGAYPSPYNYYGFPRSCCVSVNEVICHGIPDLRPFENGDLVNIDISIFVRGFHSDLNETYLIGGKEKAKSEEDIRLIQCAHDSMMAAIAICKPGVAYREIGNVIERHTHGEGFAVVRSFTGHGCDRLFHANPAVPHHANNKAKGVMKKGHVFTIEPMINAGTYRDTIWPDEWTVVTQDGKHSAQFEHCLLITDDGAEILTARLDSSPPLDFGTN